MVHALCVLNEVTVKRPTRCEGVADLPKLLRPGDSLLSADTESGFWHVPMHASSHKFFSSHFVMPAEYVVNGSSRRTSLLPGGYWAWQPAGSALRVSSLWRSNADSLPPLRLGSSPLLLVAPLPNPHLFPSRTDAICRKSCFLGRHCVPATACALFDCAAAWTRLGVRVSLGGEPRRRRRGWLACAARGGGNFD